MIRELSSALAGIFCALPVDTQNIREKHQQKTLLSQTMMKMKLGIISTQFISQFRVVAVNTKIRIYFCLVIFSDLKGKLLLVSFLFICTRMKGTFVNGLVCKK